ncbi:hypothetical protein AB1Y20_013594 [Prymnesium parvum]|uniref:Brix domain-containing protein n=1 Tax=Prymnesium parvum TaxID=97485 RepID=A0AB34IG91_PRYPA
MARTRKAGGGRRIKRKTQRKEDTADEAASPPSRCFVFVKGKVPAALKALCEDLKHMMSPNTAKALRAKKTNKLRDFVDVAGALNVHFFLILSASEKHSFLRVVRSPHGPTLTFQLQSYSLSGDLSASLRRPYSAGHGIWQSPPLLVLSDFDKSVQHEALAATMLQNLFPTFNVAEANISACRRVVLAHKVEGGGVEMRQYVITALPTGVSKGVKKLIRGAKLPSLGRYEDMAEYLLKGGYSSDSAGETDDEDKAELPQDYVGRNAKANQKVSIKLHEVGPRMSLTLLKVEEGLCDGATLYHSLVKKTPEEEAANAARIQAREALKAERRNAQKANVDAKQAVVKAKKERRKRRREPSGSEGDAGAFEGDDEAPQEADKSDADWYREEVGEQPDPDMFRSANKVMGQKGSTPKRAARKKEMGNGAKQKKMRVAASNGASR